MAVSGDFGAAAGGGEARMMTLGGLGAAVRGKFGALSFVCVLAVVLGAVVPVLR